MKSKLINLKYSLLILFLITTISCIKGSSEWDDVEDSITLHVANWLELPAKMDYINKKFMEKHPGIKVEYVDIHNTEYDREMTFQLKAGIAPDIIYLRSFDLGRKIYNTGYLKNLNDLIPELKKFPEASLKAWSNNNIIYGVPSLGVVHGIYYNKKIFNKYNLEVPNTWSELLNVCSVLKRNSETVFALGTKDNWLLYEVVFSGLGANFYGGEKTRQELLRKKTFMNDELFIETFRKLLELKEFLPSNFKSLGYNDQRELFSSGNAAMYIGGSWDISNFMDNSKDFESIGFFAPPVEKTGDRLNYCFHVDIGVAMNRTTRYPEAAEKYIKWVASKEYAEIAMDQFPGFFSYTPGNYKLNNTLAKEMQSYISSSEPTVRTLWEDLSRESPTGNELLGEAVKGLLEGNYSPEDAANYVHRGLNWFYK